MGSIQAPSFEFNNQVSPSYVEPLFLRIEPGQWYSTNDLVALLQAGGLDVEGRHIVNYNVLSWSLIGLGETRAERVGRSRIKMFRLSLLGVAIRDMFSTNPQLFYDLVHFLFYSAWPRTQQIVRARFWVYTGVCDALWSEAPSQMDSFALANALQAEAAQEFPQYRPAFPERSIGAVFPWLGALMPPFLTRQTTGKRLLSARRDYCTPQLLHLATDLVYNLEGLGYGTSMSLDERLIAAISRVCLLDEARFWEMAQLTQSAVAGFHIRKGQWGVSVSLTGPPDWIELPDFRATAPDQGAAHFPFLGEEEQ